MAEIDVYQRWINKPLKMDTAVVLSLSKRNARHPFTCVRNPGRKAGRFQAIELCKNSYVTMSETHRAVYGMACKRDAAPVHFMHRQLAMHAPKSGPSKTRLWNLLSTYSTVGFSECLCVCVLIAAGGRRSGVQKLSRFLFKMDAQFGRRVSQAAYLFMGFICSAIRRMFEKVLFNM